MPSGLDIMAVFNSSRALYHQQGEVDQFPEYLPQIETLRGEVQDWEDEAWTQNLYYLWLYTLLPLLNEKGDEYPTYMRSDAWSDKELNTALGSWAELRHDTILYTKQPYSIGPGAEGFVGIVEPNPDLISRLYSLVKLLKEGLTSRGLLEVDDPLMLKMNNFENLMLSFMTMIEKELRGEALSYEERETIFYIYDRLMEFEHFNTGEVNEDGYPIYDADDSVAIIADVFTDPNTMQVLEVGVGAIYELFVIVEDSNGIAHLTRGGVFSYYEFGQPITDRLTDEAWQEMLDTEKPDNPTWTQTFLIKKEE
jgi:hypothetical protein